MQTFTGQFHVNKKMFALGSQIETSPLNQNPKIKSLTLKSQGSKSGSTNILVKKRRSTLHVSIKNRRNKIEENSPESLDERDPQRENNVRVILVKTTWFVPYKTFGKG